jgi:SNF2-related domain
MLTAAMTHQAACVNKISALKVGALFMEMGTGKTRCYLEIAAQKIAQDKAKRLTILCPVSGMAHIAQEVQKHTGQLAVIHHEKYQLSNATTNIIGIESMSSSITAINRLNDLARDSVLVVDESHLIKNKETQRTRRILDAANLARYRYISTGMPMPNGVEDLWSQMLWCSRDILGYRDFAEFRRWHLKYTGDDWGMPGTGKICGRYNVETIAAKIAPYSFEARKADCLQLPPKSYSFRTVQLGDIAQAAYSEAKLRILMGRKAFEVDDATIYRLFTALQQISSGMRPAWLFEPGEFTELASTKTEQLQATLVSITGRAVVWCKYHAEADAAEEAVHQAGKAYWRIDGRVPLAERNLRIQHWREAGDVLICTIQTGAMVNDWGFADYSIYMSNSFDYMLRTQSEDRTHRAMMTGKAHYIDLHADTGIERRIRRSLLRKENACKAFQDHIRQLRDKRDDAAITRELNNL